MYSGNALRIRRLLVSIAGRRKDQLTQLSVYQQNVRARQAVWQSDRMYTQWLIKPEGEKVLAVFLEKKSLRVCSSKAVRVRGHLDGVFKSLECPDQESRCSSKLKVRLQNPFKQN